MAGKTFEELGFKAGEVVISTTADNDPDFYDPNIVLIEVDGKIGFWAEIDENRNPLDKKVFATGEEGNWAHSEWVKWHGGECPVPNGTSGIIMFRDDTSEFPLEDMALMNWAHYEGLGDIDQYKITSSRFVEDENSSETEDDQPDTIYNPSRKALKDLPEEIIGAIVKANAHDRERLDAYGEEWSPHYLRKFYSDNVYRIKPKPGRKTIFIVWDDDGDLECFGTFEAADAHKESYGGFSLELSCDADGSNPKVEVL